MFKLSNLRKESKAGWTYLCCDFEVTGMDNPFKENTMWVAVEDINEDMLSEKVFDPFVLIPVYLGMHYGQDVHIEGNVSARLYHNVTHYLMSIFDNFSVHTRMVKFTVNGFDTVEESNVKLIGTGISCGVDSLTTIYDNYILEEHSDYKINSLFFANCGTHGNYNKESRQLWLDRATMNRKAAEELNLPMYLIDSNLHAYSHVFGTDQKIGYLAIYSCALAMQKYVKRYLTSGNFSYEEVAEFATNSKDYDIAEYCETYMPHLISTERFELVIDGCQYTRGEKTERISNWEIAQKYLNICVNPINHGKNCSKCHKCMWTLIPLEAMGKLEEFNQVFDIDTYNKNARRWKLSFLSHEGKDAMETSVVRYARNHNLKFPSLDEANEILLLKEEIAQQRREINHLKYNNNNIVIFGAGEVLKKNIRDISDKMKIRAIVDSDSKKWGRCYGDFVCESPERLQEIENPLILVSVANKRIVREIEENLVDKGFQNILRLTEWIDI
ncbi:MAG: hypothetical protein J6C07_12440 [Lachnospiraceae bacterium]|nr:hypothetical protein [Lachnospiraceae bacterium]